MTSPKRQTGERMGEIAKEYARIKVRKLKLAGMIVGLVVGIFALVAIIGAIVFAPIWVPVELAKAGYPNVGLAFFAVSMLLLGGWFWWQHSDIKKAIDNTEQTKQ